MLWRPDQIAFEMREDETDDPVVTASIASPAGEILAMAEVEERGRVLCLRNLHLQGPGANAIGTGNLRVLAEVVMERLDYDGLEVEGAVRTTGASPGHRPRPLRFTRRSGAPGA
jgi:hypothetical protein